MVRESEPHERVSHQNKMRMQDDGESGLDELMPQLRSLIEDENREWGPALGTQDYRIITRIEFYSLLLATSLDTEYQKVVTPDGSWDTFDREHGQQVYEKAATLIKQAA